MFELTDQERKAMNWALSTLYASVAADYAKVLAKALTRAMAPSQDEAVLPEIASPDPCGSPVICKCGWIVGIMDEWGEAILDTDDTAKANYCGQCGARMDYSEFEAQQGREDANITHKHKYVPYGDTDFPGARCSVCGKDGGWWCPNSPDHTCDYRQGDGSLDNDSCRHCGQPYERK